MKSLSLLNNKAGFTLVQAIFILVVLSLLGVVMMRMIGVQSSTSVFALQGARAYQAARSGLEWGAARARAGNSCNGTVSVENFNVDVTCSNQQFTEGSIGPYDVYRIRATATFGSYGSPDYILRRAEMKVGFP
ncbi:pilus assembly protein MshP [uncultured Desulfuromusa sp.]|uniref:pilus assembly protein MshP n=1 Tax=uncultured Desulfuromusa sp. TaxID=219183 RepID=UPI002AA899DE|nr:pilus assembly protein MshP [uncultured Desulfuromusa sp.]